MCLFNNELNFCFKRKPVEVINKCNYLSVRFFLSPYFQIRQKPPYLMLLKLSLLSLKQISWKAGLYCRTPYSYHCYPIALKFEDYLVHQLSVEYKSCYSKICFVFVQISSDFMVRIGTVTVKLRYLVLKYSFFWLPNLDMSSTHLLK